MSIVQAALPGTVPYSNVIYAKHSNQKLSLPVQRQQYLYARFKHVVGVPAHGSGKGLSIFKLKLLDNIIERLSSMQSDKINKKTDITGMDAKALDAMIEKYKSKLHTEVKKSSFGFGGSNSAGGMILNMVV